MMCVCVYIYIYIYIYTYTGLGVEACPRRPFRTQPSFGCVIVFYLQHAIIHNTAQCCAPPPQTTAPVPATARNRFIKRNGYCALYVYIYTAMPIPPMDTGFRLGVQWESLTGVISARLPDPGPCLCVREGDWFLTRVGHVH